MGNPVEDNVVTRFLLGLAVIVAMMIGGGAAAAALLAVGVPYGDWLGAGVGAIVVFVAFAVVYRRYDATFQTS